MVASIWRSGSHVWRMPNSFTFMSIEVFPGAVTLNHTISTEQGEGGEIDHWTMYWFVSRFRLLELHSFVWLPSAEVSQVYGGTSRTVTIPLWMPLLLFGLPLGILLARGPLRRWRRHRRGLCLTCAYNLEGNTSGTCPECGTKVAGES